MDMVHNKFRLLNTAHSHCHLYPNDKHHHHDNDRHNHKINMISNVLVVPICDVVFLYDLHPP